MEEKAVRPKRVAIHYIPPPARKLQDTKTHEVSRAKGRSFTVSENKKEKLCNDSSLLFKDNHSDQKLPTRRIRSSGTRKECSPAKSTNSSHSRGYHQLTNSILSQSEISNLPPLETCYESCLTIGGNVSKCPSSVFHSKHASAVEKTSSSEVLESSLEKPNRIDQTRNSSTLESQEKIPGGSVTTSLEINEPGELDTVEDLNTSIEIGKLHELVEPKMSFDHDESNDSTNTIGHDSSAELNECDEISTSVELNKSDECVEAIDINSPLKLDKLTEVDSPIELNELNKSVEQVEYDSTLECNEVIENVKLLNNDTTVNSNKPVELDKAIDLSGAVEVVKSYKESEKLKDQVQPVQPIELDKLSISCDNAQSTLGTDTLLPTELTSNHPEKITPEFSIDECDWDILYDDHGDCLISNTFNHSSSSEGISELSKPVELTGDIELSKLHGDENSSIIEIYGFSEDLRTSDLMGVFFNFVSRGFILKWVDDTHALGVLPSPSLAREVLVTNLPLVKTRPISQGTSLSQEKAKKLVLPSALRPKTCSALARRLVSGALGLRVNMSPEEKAAEKKLLKEAREKKKMVSMQKEAAWEGNISLLEES